MTSKERQNYKIAGPATWELIRAAYLDGESARALAERFGVTEHAIRKRISKEGWAKRDYAVALEARGLEPPEARRLGYVEGRVAREQARQAAEAKLEHERAAELDAWVDKISAEEEAFAIADALEKRALAQAGAAMVQGRSKEAQALAGLAEQMRKRAASAVVSAPAAASAQAAAVLSEAHVPPSELEQRALAQVADALARGKPNEAKQLAALADSMRRRAEEARQAGEKAEEEEMLSVAQREEMVMNMFAQVAYLAGCMVHEPVSAPASFIELVKRWREINLGEGEEDAEEKARLIAKAQKRHLNDDWIANTPEDIRAYMMRRWEETRARINAVTPDPTNWQS